MTPYSRTELGDFSSVVCFKAVITGVEDTLGPDGAAVVFTRAGKVRGHTLVRDLDVAGSKLPVEELAAVLDKAVGKDGTRLCSVKRSYREGENIVVEVKDTVCAAGEEMGSDRLATFTLGAIWGAVEGIMGETYLGEHTESMLKGAPVEKFVFSPF